MFSARGRDRDGRAGRRGDRTGRGGHEGGDRFRASAPRCSPVARHVFMGIPVVLHEVNPLAAGTVSVAVLTPVFSMAGRNAQVDGRAVYMNTLDDGRLWMEEHWRRVTAHIDPAIKPGLADVYRYANIGGEC